MLDLNLALWERMFAQLLTFKEQHGHCQVPGQWKENPTLAKWVQRQRGHHKSGSLSRERTERLDQIGFAWTSDKLHNTFGWEKRFAELVAFQQQHGHLRVTLKSETSPGLMHWRDNQRVNLRDGTLAPERKARLDAIGFEWETPGRVAVNRDEQNTALWERMFAQLLTFKDQHGHCQVPRLSKEHPALGSWVSKQRALHKGGHMPHERTHRLDQIGFAWKAGRLNSALVWDRRFAQLIAFQQQHGHLRVTRRNETAPGLMHWRDNQRVSQRKGTLAPERKARLDAIGFEWQCPGRLSPRKYE